MALAVAKLAMERAGWREVRPAGKQHTLLGVCDVGPCAHMGVHHSRALHCVVLKNTARITAVDLYFRRSARRREGDGHTSRDAAN
jgi:hypothetical protein